MTALQPLWQIEEELQALLDCVETCPEEHQPELQAKIAAYLSQEASKVDNSAHVIAAAEYAERAHDDEIERLRANKARIVAGRERFERYLCRVIAAKGAPLKGRTNTLSVRASEAVEITDEWALPDKYEVVTVTITGEDWLRLLAALSNEPMPFLSKSERVDKVELKKALKAGEVPGAELVFRQNLQRK